MAFELHDCDLRDFDVVKAGLEEASEQAEAEGKVMTQIRLAYSLGLCKQTLSEIVNGHKVNYKGFEIPQEVHELIKKAVEYCELCVSDAGFAARNPAMSIFVLKAVHGYDDKPASAIQANTVVFIGEDKIPD